MEDASSAVEAPEPPRDPVGETATRVAALLQTTGQQMRDPTGSGLCFDETVTLRPLERREAPAEVWAVDGGQALVADARSFAVYVTRAATVRWRDGHCDLEDEGDARLHLLGLRDDRELLRTLGAPVAAGTVPDLQLLREWGEWQAVAAAVSAAGPGSVVLVDGDLQPDWRIRSEWLDALLVDAARRDVLLAGVTKHSSLTRGGAPLLGQLEREAEVAVGPRRCWWANVATIRGDVAAGLQVIVARLDPDARYAFRLDLPADTDAPEAAGRIAALCDDAAFPGYPFPLSVADRLAACPRWLREELWDELQSHLTRAGVPGEVVERAFDDRHRLMERA